MLISKVSAIAAINDLMRSSSLTSSEMQCLYKRKLDLFEECENILCMLCQ
jgi:hypothetical protein